VITETIDTKLYRSFKALKNSSFELEDSLIAEAELLAEKAGESNELELECDILTYLGRAYRLTNDAFKSINALNKAYISLNSNFPHKKEKLAEIYRSLGNVYSNSLKDYLTGIEYQTKGYHLNVPKLNCVFLNNIGSNHMSLKQYDKAMFFYNKGINNSNEETDELNLAYLNTNCGEVQIELGFPERSLKYFEISLAYCEKFNQITQDKVELMSSYWISAWSQYLTSQAYLNMNQAQMAKKALEIGKVFAEEKNQFDSLAKMYLLEGQLLIQENNLAEYERLFNTSIKRCEEQGLLRSKHEWLTEMQKIHERNGDYKKAFHITKEIIKNSEDIKAKHQEFNISQILVSKEEEILALENKNRIMQLQKDELKQFAYIVTHDLKTPLTNISNFAGLFLKMYEDNIDVKGKGYLEYVIKSAGNLTAMLSGLMQYVSFENGENEVFEDCNLEKVILGALQDNGIAEKQYQLQTNGLKTAPIRTFHLEIILENLIKNSKKFKKEETPLFLDISVEKKSEEYLFTIGDNGIGIEDKYKNQIFEIFKRLNKNESAGTGIGLSICKKIVERYMGNLWVEDNNESGCLFKFSIPTRKIRP